MIWWDVGACSALSAIDIFKTETQNILSAKLDRYWWSQFWKEPGISLEEKKSTHRVTTNQRQTLIEPRCGTMLKCCSKFVVRRFLVWTLKLVIIRKKLRAAAARIVSREWLLLAREERQDLPNLLSYRQKAVSLDSGISAFFRNFAPFFFLWFGGLNSGMRKGKDQPQFPWKT